MQGIILTALLGASVLPGCSKQAPVYIKALFICFAHPVPLMIVSGE